MQAWPVRRAPSRAPSDRVAVSRLARARGAAAPALGYEHMVARLSLFSACRVVAVAHLSQELALPRRARHVIARAAHRPSTFHRAGTWDLVAHRGRAMAPTGSQLPSPAPPPVRAGSSPGAHSGAHIGARWRSFSVLGALCTRRGGQK